MIVNSSANVKSISQDEANKSHLRSKTAWSKKGLDVVGEPIAYVVTSTKRTIGPILPWHLRLEQLGENLFLVADDWYGVYSASQTVKKSPIESSNVHLESKDTSTQGREGREYLSPLDRKLYRKNERKSLAHKELTSRKKSSKTKTSKTKVNSGYWSYVPAFTDHDIQALGDDLGKALIVSHLLYILRFLSDRRRSNDWIDLSAQFMQDLMGGKWENWKYIRDRLLVLNILERTEIAQDTYGLGIELPRGVKGGLCYGYRLREDLRHSTHKKRLLDDQTAHRWLDRFYNLKKKRTVHRCLERLLQLVEMLDVEEDYLRTIAINCDDEEYKDMKIEEKVKRYKQQIQAIQDGEWWLKVDDETGRVYTPIVVLKRELRKFLRVQGEPLQQIDIKSCQPLLIGHLARKAGYVDERYIRLCETGLYQYLADKLGVEKADAKKELCQGGLFASNTSWHQKSKTMKLFKQEFPVIWQYITDIKNYTPKTTDNDDTKKKPHRLLAIKAQRLEAKIIIESVCDRIRKEHPDVFFTTIHDSILFLKKDAGLIKVVLTDEFAKLHLYPTTNE